jgi:hypothetical protein
MTRRSHPSSKPKATPAATDSSDYMVRAFLGSMLVSGTPTPIIYAFLKTGRFASERNWHLLSAEEKKEWNRAIREYARLHAPLPTTGEHHD